MNLTQRCDWSLYFSRPSRGGLASRSTASHRRRIHNLQAPGRVCANGPAKEREQPHLGTPASAADRYRPDARWTHHCRHLQSAQDRCSNCCGVPWPQEAESPRVVRIRQRCGEGRGGRGFPQSRPHAGQGPECPHRVPAQQCDVQGRCRRSCQLCGRPSCQDRQGGAGGGQLGCRGSVGLVCRWCRRRGADLRSRTRHPCPRLRCLGAAMRASGAILARNPAPVDPVDRL